MSNDLHADISIGLDVEKALQDFKKLAEYVHQADENIKSFQNNGNTAGNLAKNLSDANNAAKELGNSLKDAQQTNLSGDKDLDALGDIERGLQQIGRESSDAKQRMSALLDIVTGFRTLINSKSSGLGELRDLMKSNGMGVKGTVEILNQLSNAMRKMDAGQISKLLNQSGSITDVEKIKTATEQTTKALDKEAAAAERVNNAMKQVKDSTQKTIDAIKEQSQGKTLEDAISMSDQAKDKFSKKGKEIIENLDKQLRESLPKNEVAKSLQKYFKDIKEDAAHVIGGKLPMEALMTSINNTMNVKPNGFDRKIGEITLGNGQTIGDSLTNNLIPFVKENISTLAKAREEMRGVIAEAERLKQAQQLGDKGDVLAGSWQQMDEYQEEVHRFSEGERKTFPKSDLANLKETQKVLSGMQNLLPAGFDENLDKAVAQIGKLINVTSGVYGQKGIGNEGKSSVFKLLFGSEEDIELSKKAEDVFLRIQESFGKLDYTPIKQASDNMKNEMKEVVVTSELVEDVFNKIFASEGETNASPIKPIAQDASEAKESVNELNASINELNQTNNQATVSDGVNQAADSAEQAADKIKELEIEKAKLAEQQSESTPNDQFQAINTELEATKSALAETKQELESVKQELEELKSSGGNDASNDLFTQMTQQISDLQDEIKKAEVSVEEYKAAWSNAQNALDNSVQLEQYQKLEAEIEKLKAENDTLLQSIKQTQAQIDEWSGTKQNVETYEQQVNQVIQSISTLKNGDGNANGNYVSEIVEAMIGDLSKLNTTVGDVGKSIYGSIRQIESAVNGMGLDNVLNKIDQSTNHILDGMLTSVELLIEAFTQMNMGVGQFSEGASDSFGAVNNEISTTQTNARNLITTLMQARATFNGNMERTSQTLRGTDDDGRKITMRQDANGGLIGGTVEVKTEYARLKNASDEYIRAAKEFLKAVNRGDQQQIEAARDAMESTRDNYQNMLQEFNAVSDNEKAEIQANTNKVIDGVLNEANMKQSESAIKRVADSLKQLIKARKEYVAAMRGGDANDRSQAETNVRNAEQVFMANVENAEQLSINADQQERINRLVQEEGANRRRTGKELSLQQALMDGSEKIMQRMVQWVTSMLVMRELRKIWSDALTYAKSYYDSLNSIRIVTGASAEDARKMGGEYRELAEELKVSSLTISDAMEKIYRQGYENDEDVAGIQKWATIFGAITGGDTSSALGTMTAALQNFQKDGESMTELGQRVADTWSYLGDAVATSAADIGTSMSKVAGSAKNVGLQLEQTSAWAAIVMAKTQESAESVGNSLNSMISRYTKMTQAGYKNIVNKTIEDDEGESISFNDVSAALKKVGIEVYNTTTGFANFGDVMDELGGKWATLDASSKNYIAYQMAGTRNMNRFITLMDNYGKATELTNEALNAQGTAMSKYEIWADSVAAAQNDLTNSLEKTYSMLMDGEAIKGFYNTLTWIVDGFNNATEATHGLNVALPATVAVIGLVAAAMMNLSKLMGALTAHPVGAAIAGIGVAITVISGLVNLFDEMTVSVDEAIDATAELSGNILKNRKPIEDVTAAMDQFSISSEDPNKSLSELESIIGQITAIAPYMAEQFDLNGVSQDNMAEKADNAKRALEELSKQQMTDEWMEARANSENTRKAFTSAANAMNIYGRLQNYKTASDIDNLGTLLDLSAADGDARKLADAYAAMEEARKTLDEIKAANGEQGKAYNDALLTYQEKQVALDNVISELHNNMKNAAVSMATEMINPEKYTTEDKYNIIDIILGSDFTNVSAADIESYVYGKIVEYDKGLKDAWSDAKQLIGQAQKDGMTIELFTPMQNLAQQLKEQYPDIDFGFDQYLDQYVDQLEKFFDNAGDNAMKLSGKGLLNTKIMKAINDNQDKSQGIEGFNAADFWDQLLAADTATMTAQEIVDLVNEIFSNLGVEPVEEAGNDLIAISEIMKKAAESFREAAQEYNNIKLSNNGYKDILSGLKDGKGIAEVAKDYATAALGGNAGDEDVNSYAADIIKNMTKDNPWLGLFLDNDGLLDGAKSVEAVLNEMEDMDAFRSMNVSAEWLRDNLSSDADEAERLQELLQLLADVNNERSLSGMAEGFNRSREDNRASRDGYGGQIEELQGALGSEGIEEAISVWREFDDSIQDGILETFPEVVQALDDVKKAMDDSGKESENYKKKVQKLKDVLEDAYDRSDTKYFEDTEDAMKSLTKGTTTVEKATKAYWQDVDKLADAQKAFNAIQEKGIDNFDTTSSEVKTLSDWLGVTSSELMSNWDASGISNAIASATSESEGYLNRLQDAALIEFVMQGRSDIDLSQARGQLIAVESLAAGTAETLSALGLYTIETVTTQQNAAFWNADTMSWEESSVSVNSQVLKPATGNPHSGGSGKKSTGGGGSGGGGGGSKKVSKEVQKLEDEIDAAKKLHDNYLELLQLKEKYYETTGQIQSQATLIEEEIAETGKYSDAIREEIQRVQEQIDAKQAVMDKNRESSKAYKKAAVDVDSLNEYLHELNKQLIENDTNVVSLTKSLRDLHDAINQSIVDVEDMIRSVLEAEKEADDELLNAKKAVEDEILEILRERYEEQEKLEKEALQASIDAAEARRDALEEEIDALDEALDKRRKLADEADKAAELAKLEAQYARISADPTRAREALDIQKKIRDLREEIAWDAAEAEVEAQKQALQDQADELDDSIEDMEDQMDEIEKYYEDLFEHPQKLIAEMKDIIKRSNAEILAWLKDNSKEYKDSTDTTQEYMERSWQEMLDDMIGYTETYESAIREIMSWTDEEIVAWLKEHDLEFKNATEAQQELFISGWRETLDIWRKAISDSVEASIQEMEKLAEAASAALSGGSGGGGGGGSGGSGGGYSVSSSTTSDTEKVGSIAEKIINSASKVKEVQNNITSAKKLGDVVNAMQTWHADQDGNGSATSKNGIENQYVIDGVTYQKPKGSAYYFKKKDAETKTDPATKKDYLMWFKDPRFKISKYASGGIADFTGMAWLDGSKTRPERVLSAEQTMLFDQMVQALQEIRHIQIPFGMGFDSNMFKDNDGTGAFTIENIEVRVENLAEDTDYDELAEKVGEALQRKLSRGRSVGGITKR